jgi:hypothetical protein
VVKCSRTALRSFEFTLSSYKEQDNIKSQIEYASLFARMAGGSALKVWMIGELSM